MNIGDMCRLPLLGLTALLILSGCAAQRTSMPDFFSSSRTGSMSIIELTAQEEEAFSRTGELDRVLDPTMDRLVKYHFVKYSREKRVTMEYFLRNGMSYINHTKSVFRSRGLPQDLAYLAYLESGYNPLAVSSSKATGMWQFIASTGKIYGLRQDWWMDERMDPYRSTQAAADYLTRLYEIFHDWHLAIASYNGGEGAVGRARKAAGASSLPDLIRGNDKLDPSLKLREETQLYVPRFLAIAKIMRNAELLELRPAAPDADHPVLLPVKALSVKPATDLVELSRRLGMTWKLFLAYNPHFLRSVSPVDATSTIYIPLDKADKAQQLLQSNIAGAGWRYYKVARNETFASISRKTGVPASILRALNPGELKRGKRLRMPSVKGSIPPVEPFVPNYESQPVTAKQLRDESHVSAALADLENRVTSTPAEYVVERGDTLSGIAKKFNTSVRDIEAANGGKNRLKTLRAGQVLKLPVTPEEKRDVVVVSKKTVAVVPVDISQREHKVKSGDTLSGIAKKYKTTVREIEAANGGASKLKTLRIGQIIKLPFTQEQRRAIEEARKARAAEEARLAELARAHARAEALKATEHKVQSGDTLSAIAKKYETTVRALQEANGGAGKLKTLRIGQVIKLPARKAAAPVVENVAKAKTVSVVKGADKAVVVKKEAVAVERNAEAAPAEHTVQSGDTLSGIARKYGTTVRALQEANGGADKLKTLRIGQIIKLPVEEAAAAALSELAAARKNPGTAPAGAVQSTGARKAQPKAPSAAPQPEEYVVKNGDSVWGISRRFGMTVEEFKKLNAMDDGASLRMGDVVKVIRRK